MGRTDAAEVLARVEVYNSALASIASGVVRQAEEERLVHPGELLIRVVDARSRFDEVLANPSQYGFTNASESCLRIDSESAFSYLQRQHTRKHCEAGRFVFWDTLHPTTRMHELMSTWAAASAPRDWNLH
jgi:thermolabile hemolysin